MWVFWLILKLSLWFIHTLKSRHCLSCFKCQFSIFWVKSSIFYEFTVQPVLSKRLWDKAKLLAQGRCMLNRGSSETWEKTVWSQLKDSITKSCLEFEAPVLSLGRPTDIGWQLGKTYCHGSSKGRGRMFFFCSFTFFHFLSPLSLFHLYNLFYLSSPFLWETTQNDPQELTCCKPQLSQLKPQPPAPDKALFLPTKK